jgi:hypothetical protein
LGPIPWVLPHPPPPKKKKKTTLTNKIFWARLATLFRVTFLFLAKKQNH